LLTSRQWRQLWYLPVLAAAMALMMLRLMVAARLFDVEAFAQYNTGLLLSTTFCMLGCLGLQQLLQRDMPILLARGRERAALVLLLQAVWVGAACALVAVLPAALAAGIVQAHPMVAVLGVLHGLSQQLFVVATVESRSRGDALRYAWQNLVRAGPVVGGGALVAWATGSPALVLATEAVLSLALIGGILGALLRRGRCSLGLLATLARRGWRRPAWATAGVMLTVSIVSFVLLNLDRWVAVSWLAPAAFAQFAFAAIVLLAAQSIQNMVNATVHPMIARRFGLQGTGAAFRLSSGVSLATLAAALVLAWPAHELAQFAIRRWFPAYAPAIELLWPLLAAAVLRVSDYWSSFLLICNHERQLLKLQLGVGAAAAGGWVLFLAGRGGFAPTVLDVCWLSFVLAAASHAATAGSAFALRASDSTKGRMSHAQSQ